MSNDCESWSQQNVRFLLDGTQPFYYIQYLLAVAVLSRFHAPFFIINPPQGSTLQGFEILNYSFHISW